MVGARADLWSFREQLASYSLQVWSFREQLASYSLQVDFNKGYWTQKVQQGAPPPGPAAALSAKPLCASC